MFSQRCHVRRLAWVIMAFGLLSPGARNTAMAAPPDFAGVGMAPNNVDVVVRMSGAEGSGDWARYFEDVASDSLGTQAVDQWRTLTSFLRSIVGEGVDGGGPVSHLYIRLGAPAMNPDWAYAIELFDRQKCEQGFRDSEAVLKGGGGFLLPQANIEVHASGKWLIAGPLGSALRDEVSGLAAIEVNATDDAQVLEVIQAMPRSPIEIVIRHQSPTGGCTAAAFSEISPGVAEVFIAGKYDSSPLPSRAPGNLDVRLITDDTDHASIAIYESGIGILDPLLIDIGLSIPEVLPPADVRKGLELQRLIVLETLDIANGVQLPALCLAVPFRVAAEEEVQNVSSAIHTWMTKLTNISLSNPREGFDLETADTPLRTGVLDGIRKHPMAKGASLHWAVSTGVSSRTWFIAGTTFESVQRLSARLGSLVDTDSMNTESASQGVVHADQLSEVIEAFADMRKDNADVYAQSDSRLLNVMVSIASRFKDVRWDFKLQDPQEISGRIELSIPDSISSSEEAVRP